MGDDANDHHRDDHVPNSIQTFYDYPTYGGQWWNSLSATDKIKHARYDPAFFVPTSPADIPSGVSEWTYNWYIEGRSGPGGEPPLPTPLRSHTYTVAVGLIVVV